ncbi:ROK family protein [Patescibacteria group bacterium]|nr:ROK family protein [Patescibacteria group bacterium]
MAGLFFDIGGTSIRAAFCQDGKSLGEPKILETPKDFNEGILLLKKTAEELSGGKKIQSIVVGIAGAFDREKTQLLASPNLPGWVGKPLKVRLYQEFGSLVFIENDAALAGLGEAVYGAGKGKEIVAYMTISTGVGGARIIKGKIDVSAKGFEPGHQIIDAGAVWQGEYDVLTLENAISGTAFEKRFGKKPYEITDEKIWDEAARILAIGLNNSMVYWSPDIVVLGGSMMKEVGIPIERIRFHLKNILKIFREPSPIEKAALGDAAGLYGGLAFLNPSG